MTIRFACRCGKKMRTVDDKIGKKVLCPECGSPVIVPEKSTAGVTALPDAKSAVATSSTAGELLRQSSAVSKRTQSEEELSRSLNEKESRFDKEQMKDFMKFAVPGVVGILLICMVIYWFSSMIIGPSVERPPLARVWGVVTLEGKPLEGAIVEFQPLDKKVPGTELGIASSQAKTNKEGEYELFYSQQEVRGAYIGKHRVMITKTNPKTGRQMIPVVYNFKTALRETIEDKSNEINFKLSSQAASSRR